MSNPAFPLLLGLILGWLVNYLADVLPSTRRLSRPACPHCGAALPPAGYLLGQNCSQCAHRRLFRFWLVMLVMVAASLYTAGMPPKLGYFPGLLLLLYFGVVFVIDAEHRLILHPTSIVGAGLCFIAGWLLHGLVPTLLGGLAGFLIMFILYALGWLFTRLRLRRLQAAGETADDEEALGQGDVILATVLGFLLGWPLIWFGLLLGILLGGGFGILLIIWMLVARRYHKQALMVFMPYGPFFILSASFIIFFPKWLAAMLPA